ncbi:MAG TPA: heparan-alpha-glucosaminide N-acetyltransferase domain-containing protein [Polyangia bacterium]|jgi:uncharacterized membrane protein
MNVDGRVTRRSLFIDATRGLAMALVCVSHFGISYFGFAGDRRDKDLTGLIALPATPTFVILSGLLLGFLSVRNRATFPDLGLKLMDRGLFLLGPAHALIVAAHLLSFKSARFIFVTDAIGICILTGPWLVKALSSTARLALGTGLLLVAWCLFLTWKPLGVGGGLVRSIFIGDAPFAHGWLTFPLLPWLGTYLVATPLGELLAVWIAAGKNWVARLGSVSLVVMAAGLVLHLLGRGQSPAIRDLLSGLKKYPPGPAYLLACGGGGLGMTTFLGWLEQRKRLMSLLSLLATVGRSSLVVFVVQYFIYYVGFTFLRLPVTHLWPIYLATSLVLVFGVAFSWDRYLGNEYLTVGLPYLTRGRHRTAPAAEP